MAITKSTIKSAPPEAQVAPAQYAAQTAPAAPQEPAQATPQAEVTPLPLQAIPRAGVRMSTRDMEPAEVMPGSDGQKAHLEASEALPPFPEPGNGIPIDDAMRMIDARMREILARAEAAAKLAVEAGARNVVHADPAAVAAAVLPDLVGRMRDALTSGALADTIRETVSAVVVAAIGDGATPALVERVAGAVWQPLTNLVEMRLSQIEAKMRADVESWQAAQTAKIDQLARPATSVVTVSGAPVAAPIVRFTQMKKHVQHPPRVLDSGEIALILNADPMQPNSSEIVIPDVGSKTIGMGYRVEIPDGWLADVTVDGIAGQRVHVGTLYGATHKDGELKLSLRSDRRHTVQAGHEVARLHLRPCSPSVMRWTNLIGVESDGVPEEAA